MIKVKLFKDVYEGDPMGVPEMQSSLLTHHAEDFIEVATLLQNDQSRPVRSFGVRLLAMHQSVELLVKAIALRSVDYFQDAMRGHKVLRMLEKHKGAVPLFGEILRSTSERDLIEELEKGYLQVRYGEAHVSYDDETWRTFLSLTSRLLAQAMAPHVPGTLRKRSAK